MTPELDQLTREIYTLDGHAQARLQNVTELQTAVGKRLARAKELLPRSEFRRWTERDLGWDGRTVRKHLELAKEER